MSVITTQAREDRLLTNVSQKRVVDGTIADQVLTTTQVVKSSGLVGKYGNQHLRLEHDIVGGDTPYPRITGSVKSSDRYLIVKHGLSGVLTEEMKDNEEQPFDARKDLSDDVTDKILLGKERAIAEPLGDTAILTNNVTLSGTDQYDDYSNSDPLGDWVIARKAIYDNSGQIVDNPNGFAIVPWQLVNVLAFHPAILALVGNDADKTSGVSNEQLRKALKVGRLLIPWCQFDAAAEGLTEDIQPCWGSNIVFGFAPKTGTKRIKTLGFKVQRKSPRRVFINSQNEPPNSELIQVDDSYDYLLTDVGAAYLIKDAI